MSSVQYKRKIDSGDDPKEQQLAQLKIENGESISFKKKRSRLENVLLALALVLTVLCIVFIVLYATKSKTGTGDTKSNAGNGTNSGSQGGGTGGNTQGNSTCNTTSSSTNICTSADCVTVASGKYMQLHAFSLVQLCITTATAAVGSIMLCKSE